MIKIAKKFQVEYNNDMLDSTNKAKKYNDIINLSIGDPDLITDLEIMKKGFVDVCNGETHYTDPLGYRELREEIVKFYNEEYNTNIGINNVMVVSSATMGLFLALNATLDEGDEVIVLEPYFTPYKKQIAFTGAIPKMFSLHAENNFQVNYEELKQAVTPKTKGIVVNYPTNPTGGVFTLESLENIARVAKEFDLIVYADDIYTIFNYDKPFTPIATLDDMFDRTITIRSFSKDYCMTGFRIGWIVCPEYLINTFNTLNECCIYTVPSFSQRVALYGLQERERIQPLIKEEFKKRLDYVYKRVQEIDWLDCKKPEGSIYIFLDIRKTGMTSSEFTSYCLDKYHIIVLSGTGFGDSGEGFVRIALTCGVEKLAIAFDRFKNL